MKIKKVITKKTVIEALRKEPLMAGAWFDNETSPMDCNVCAVGAVLRRVSAVRAIMKLQDDEGMIGTYCDINEFVAGKLFPNHTRLSSDARPVDIARYLKKKNYLAALSAKFESLVVNNSDGIPNDCQRQSLVDFVTINFPEKFTIEM